MNKEFVINTHFAYKQRIELISDAPIRLGRMSETASIVQNPDDVAAILIQVAMQLDQLINEGESGTIDLQGLQLSLADHERLLAVLGRGEIVIKLEVDGESTIRDTGIPGVWWSEFRDEAGHVVAQFIEIARVPTVLPALDDEMLLGVLRLRACTRYAGQRA